MTNHVHLIAVPRRADSLARTVGRTHMRVARGANRLQKWSGHLTLKGDIVENTCTTATLTDAVVLLHHNEAAPVSFIDRSGNLKVRHSVYVAEDPDASWRKFE